MNNYKNLISLNKQCDNIISKLINNSTKYQLKVYKGPEGCIIIDAGIKALGSIEAGLEISKICLGGLGNVEISPYNFSNNIMFSLKTPCQQLDSVVLEYS